MYSDYCNIIGNTKIINGITNGGSHNENDRIRHSA